MNTLHISGFGVYQDLKISSGLTVTRAQSREAFLGGSEEVTSTSKFKRLSPHRATPNWLGKGAIEKTENAWPRILLSLCVSERRTS